MGARDPRPSSAGCCVQSTMPAAGNPTGTLAPPSLFPDVDGDPDNWFHENGARIDKIVHLRNSITGEIVATEWWYEDPITGEYTMTTNSQQVGRNEPPASVQNIQLVGEYKREYFDAVLDIAKVAADLRADAVAAGTMLRGIKSDGTEVVRAATVTDFIAKIDIDLKPIYGGEGALGEDAQATTSEAVVGDNSTTQNLDGGGSRTFGDLKSGSEHYYIRPDFDTNGTLDISAGSVVEVTVVMAALPVDETTL